LNGQNTASDSPLARARLGQGQVEESVLITQQVSSSVAAVGSRVVSVRLREMTEALAPYTAGVGVATVLTEADETGAQQWGSGRADVENKGT
jgi:hypothetical protein